jgi:hypothetical protein
MRRVLFVIPHYFARGNGFYGSTGSDPESRVNALERVIGGLHQGLGYRQAFMLWLKEHVPGEGNGTLIHSNDDYASHTDVVVCTTGETHLIKELGIPSGLYHHQPTNAEPMLLGFACHQVLRSQLGRYDWYCYLEDDILINDPLFFPKMEWFISQHGEDAVLAPHRFERSVTEPALKMYVDGSVRPDFTKAWQDIDDRRHLESEAMGMKLKFERWPNPNWGGFFLNAKQMDEWVSRPYFGDFDCSFCGSIESACNLGVIKTFRQYKPAPANAGFFEVEHLHPRYLGEQLKFS